MTADFMLSTPRTVSSALLPELMRNQTPTLLLQQRRAQSSQTLRLTLITTPFGGRVLTRIRPRMQSTGRATPGTVKRAKRRVLTPTAASLRLQRIAPASALSLRIPTVFRFLHLYSADAARLSHPLFISQETGTTVYLSAQSWHLRQLPPQQAQSA